jgi:hypothetical protein
VGSSITITRAFVVNAFAISTSCWSAIDSPRAGRSGSRRTPAVDAAEALERLHPDEDVLGDAQVGKERRLLEDDRDPGGLRLLRVVEDRFLSVEHEPPGVGTMNTGEDLHERRLARTVLADEAVDLAAEQLDVAVLESVHSAEALLGVLEEEHGGGMRLRHDRCVRGRGAAMRHPSPSVPRS